MLVQGDVSQLLSLQVRNSGVWAVVEGAGDHCCEYMTGWEHLQTGWFRRFSEQLRSTTGSG